MTTATISNEDLTLLAGTPALATARQQAAAERLRKRQSMVDRIAQLRGELSRVVPDADQEIKKAMAGVESARTHLLEAERVLREAHCARAQAASPREHEIQKLTNQLRAEPCPKIDAFLIVREKAEETFRREWLARPQSTGRFDPPEALERQGREREAAAERARVKTEAKAHAEFLARLESFRSARVEADGLRERALSDAELDAELDRIAQTVGIA